MKVTRTDVAKLAGVSTATVSYVLNGSRSMSEKTRKLVLDAVEQLNYKPDMIARSMTKNETRQLSFMVNDATNPFYGEIIVGFENAAMERGYFVNICTGTIISTMISTTISPASYTAFLSLPFPTRSTWPSATV